jgi:hypothetical protein
MKQLIVMILIIRFSNCLFSQNKYDYVWDTGYSFTKPWGFQLNFNNGKVRIDTFRREYEFLETVASISDSTGKFQFSTNGCKVFNKNFSTMENGDSLNLVSPLFNSCIITESGEVIQQGALILPVPNSKDSLFALFRTEVNGIIVPQQNLLPKNLYYSLINMKANAGLGKVVVKNRIIVNDTLDGGNISAVKHSNGRDWWVITRKFMSNRFFTFRFSASQIDSSFTQVVGEPTLNLTQGGGRAVFSSNGLLYAYFAGLNHLMLYDFDRQGGKLSNFRRVIIPTELNGSELLFSSISISPNSRFLYIFATKEVIQVDLQAMDIPSSIIQVAKYDPIVAPFAFPTNSELGPDCKIYFTSTNGIQIFGYIRYPDRKGIACQVVQAGIKLPYNVAIVGGMPNNPNYRLGVIPTHPCDSTIDFRVPTKETFTKIDVNVFPNPSTGNVTLDWDDGINTEGGIIRVFNMLGQMVFQQTIPSIDTRVQLELNVPSGVYHIRMNFKENKVFQGRVLITK